MPTDPLTGKFTPGNPAKKPGDKPNIPMTLYVNDRDFGEFFKLLMKDILMGNKRVLQFPSRNTLDMHLRRTLVRGQINELNFDDRKNAAILNDMVNDLWDSFKPILKRKVAEHGKKFSNII